MLDYTLRPISDHTWQRPGERERSRFGATWSDTLDLLERELRFLDATDVVIEVDVREQDIRLDGRLRANAKASSPAVVVAFEAPRLGSLQYRLDRFERPTYGGGARTESWQHNVRGIALTLESLRAVDRYGPTKSAQQYQGYRAIEAARPVEQMSIPDAYDVIAEWAEAHAHELRPGGRMHDTRDIAIKRARRRSHPDTGGSAAAFAKVQAAAKALGR